MPSGNQRRGWDFKLINYRGLFFGVLRPRIDPMGALLEAPVLESAELLIEQRGDDALAQALRRAEWCARAGDECGVALWRQVAEAILEQQSPGVMRLR